MDNMQTIDKKIDYLRNIITDWDLEIETKALYEVKITELQAQKTLLTNLSD